MPLLACARAHARSRARRPMGAGCTGSGARASLRVGPARTRPPHDVALRAPYGEEGVSDVRADEVEHRAAGAEAVGAHVQRDVRQDAVEQRALQRAQAWLGDLQQARAAAGLRQPAVPVVAHALLRGEAGEPATVGERVELAHLHAQERRKIAGRGDGRHLEERRPHPGDPEERALHAQGVMRQVLPRTALRQGARERVAGVVRRRGEAAAGEADQAAQPARPPVQREGVLQAGEHRLLVPVAGKHGVGEASGEEVGRERACGARQRDPSCTSSTAPQPQIGLVP